MACVAHANETREALQPFFAVEYLKLIAEFESAKNWRRAIIVFENADAGKAGISNTFTARLPG